jgi:hypothetical protein
LDLKISPISVHEIGNANSFLHLHHIIALSPGNLSGMDLLWLCEMSFDTYRFEIGKLIIPDSLFFAFSWKMVLPLAASNFNANVLMMSGSDCSLRFFQEFEGNFFQESLRASSSHLSSGG